ncbi:MAG: acyltransferase [Reyranella sp.]|uniref:acyltransferase family protein n=1 Tax=Reyranella sp. TaxID=1929291 RepID=UPI0012143018|nr:acyltransferase family protein [Reyranella sp.]TAJ85075.1 MAG: acyltransferase [Reyranella sp.]TBR27680.1 MAG: acyltransferase [Reyranella sp.]
MPNVSQPPWKSSNYRPDIDGLRAVSIIAVMLFHAFPDDFRGGFIGVDVFFVISGFLIGGLITQELDAHTFGFRTFYARRVRRIFPALVVVVAFVLWLGWNSMFAQEFRQLGRHVIAATLFVSNFALLDEVGYFDMEAHTKPLLHLWSLAIEEQFYLLWPLFAWALRNRRRLFVAATLVITLGSFAASVTSTDNSAAFYLPSSRIWELAVGVLLAHVPRQSLAGWLKTPVSRNVADLAGLGAIVLAASITDARSFPGFWPLLPVLGAALVIATGPQAFSNRHLLASRPMVWVGKISYPLYLWHWPLFAYAWLAYGAKPPVEVRFALLAVSVLLAWLTYVLVEKPIRFGIGRSYPVPALSVAMLLLGMGGIAILDAQGVPGRSIAEINRSLAYDLRVPTDSRTSDGTCARKYGVETGEAFVCFVNSPAPRMLVIGDSVSMAFYSAIRAGLYDEKAAFVGAHSFNWARPECGKPGNLRKWMAGGEVCQRVVWTALDILAREPSIEIVVIPTYSRNPFFTDEDALAAFQQSVHDLGRKVAYVMSVPQFGNPPAGCHPRRLFVLGFDVTRPGNDFSCRQLRSELEPDLQRQRELFRKMSKPGTGALLFDAFEPFCDKVQCYQSDKSGPLYWSWAHVNERGSSLVLREFLPWLHTVASPRP